MEDSSVFPDITAKPTDKDLAEKLDSKYELWKQIHDMVLSKYPNGLAEWNYPGKKYGWFFRIKDKKRAIIYLLPRNQYFKVAFVFGDKAVNEIMKSKISNDIKTEISQATKYAEGRGIRIDVIDDSIIFDIEQLIDIKLNN
ncbi:MAG: hypothetical protein CVT99_05580 [Bacteroidetes bacterium HGW-Bacteroidetes-16]|jgi:DNA-directed RNA polymerase subunit K/omega|nr:MAG: hypothetical protein CVT99_05580 [Bacteroidetes bacterium HGW-Bacteroidetes-16]